MIAGLLAVRAGCGPRQLAGRGADRRRQTNQCADTPQKKAKQSMFGGLLGSIADSALGHVGGISAACWASLPVGSMLSDAIINLLDCKEQQQAAKATDDAHPRRSWHRGRWKSETRANVSGNSKVTGQEALADGSQCMTVNDVVIVDGEETTVPKKMCRRPAPAATREV